jgi:ATP-binding cassette, subfamily B, bacterial
VLSLGFGAWLYHAGAITLGTVYLLFGYTELLRRPLERIVDQLQEAQESVAGVARVGRLLAARPSVAGGGPEAASLPGTPGEAVSRFRDDVDDPLQFLDTWLDVAGTLLFAGIAVAVMVRIDPVVTVAVTLPLAGMAVATRTLAARIRRWRRADREATAAVTGFLGELFASVLTVKAAGAADAALRRLGELNRTRGRAALRDQLCTDALDSFNASTVDVGIGLVLLLAAPAMRRGDFTVGDLTLFASYTGHLIGLPYFGGRLLVRRRQAGVAVERMVRLLPPATPARWSRPGRWA